MAVELKLVLEIEKHECLYNFNSSDYSRKDLTEKAWARVAGKAGLSVADTKEKWRNIRSSFIRSMKPPAGSLSRAKKPYYLKDYLKFILPYVKPINNAETSVNVPRPKLPGPEVTGNDDLNLEFNDDQDQAETSSGPQTPTSATAGNSKGTSLSDSQAPAIGHRRKRPISEVNKTFDDYLKTTSSSPKHPTESEQNISHEHYTNRNFNANQYFLLSLLPDLDTMTPEQIRAFKIKVMLLIDQIKSEESSSTIYTFDSSSIGSPVTFPQVPDQTSSLTTRYKSEINSPEQFDSLSDNAEIDF